MVHRGTPHRLRGLRALVATTSALALSATIAGLPASADLPSAPSPGAGAFVREFAAADPSNGAMFRWWWPASVEADVAVEQLEQVAAAGYRGVEIAFVMDGTDYVVDPNEYGYGDDNWQAAVKAVLRRANELGVQVDLTLGGRWPAAVPGLDVTTEAASQELVTARALVTGGGAYAGQAPAPAPRTYQERTVVDGSVVTETKTSPATLTSVVAVRCLDVCAETPALIDLSSVVPVDFSEAGDVAWTAPADGTWALVSAWQRGTAQRNDAPFGTSVSPLSAPESRVVNHFTTEGTEAMLEWFGSILDDETRTLLRANGGAIFEDSLELKGAQLWTADFFAAFEEQHGYSLEQFLPVVAYAEPGNPFAPAIAQYGFGSREADQVERIRWDVDQTLDRLWTEEHVEPIVEWAEDLGLQFRAQPYGEPIDIGAAAAVLGVTECETLGCSEQQFRTASAGVALAGKTLVTSEMLPRGFGNLYGLTPAEIAAGVNREYSLGANRMVFHGLPYPTTPPSADGSIVDSAASWPGFHGFSTFIGEAFGPRQATWTMEQDISGYYARMQQTLQEGTARYDIAVLNQAFDGGDPTIDGSPLDAAGYTYAYATPGSLAGQDVGQGRLAPDGPAFKALVIGSDPIDLANLETIAGFAADGLPVVVLDGGPTRARGWTTDAAAAAEEDAAVQEMVAQILSGPRALEADDAAGAVDALSAAGIMMDADVSTDGVKVVQRSSQTGTFYVLINRTEEAVSTEAALVGSSAAALPFLLDPWTGEATVVGVSSTQAGRTVVPGIEIEAGGAAIVALASPSFLPGSQASKVIETDALDAAWASGRVTLTADDNGTYTTRLDNRRVVTTKVTGVPAPVALGDWDLALTEWLPGTGDDPSSLTRFEEHVLPDFGATPWSSITAFENAVGVGSYTTTVTADAALASASAVLEFGAVNGSFRVYVNDQFVGVADQFGAGVDLGSALVVGQNTIRVDVASTLLNRLLTHRAGEFAGRTPTVNGLTGPVTLDPYAVVTSK